MSSSSVVEYPAGYDDNMAMDVTDAAAAAAGGEPLNDVAVTYSSHDVIVVPSLNASIANQTNTPIETISQSVNMATTNNPHDDGNHFPGHVDPLGNTPTYPRHHSDIEVMTPSALSAHKDSMATYMSDKPNDYIELSIFSCLLNIVTGIIALNFASKLSCVMYV